MSTHQPQNVKLSELKQGLTIVADSGFPCMAPGPKTVQQDSEGYYVSCNHGKHYLVGQDGNGYLVGFTQTPRQEKNL